MAHLNLRNLLLVSLAVSMAGCAAHYSASAIQDPYGFFSGVWHGAIATLTITVNIFSWFLSLFGVSFFNDIQIIGRPNTGVFYYIGFAIGFLWIPLIR